MTLPAAIAPGRVNIAFTDRTLEPNPTWTRLDDTPGLVASYTIDRGRQYELDRTDGGRAQVTINDRYGLLDPTNPSSPFYGDIDPLKQITLGRYNPVAGEWQTRFRGFVSQWNYLFHPSQQVNVLTLDCVDIFDVLNVIQLLPPKPDGTIRFGDVPDYTDPTANTNAAAFIYYASRNVHDQITKLLGECGIPDAFWFIFTGNVTVVPQTYSPGETALALIQEWVDAELPFVANLYPDRFGRACFHGRYAKTNPGSVAGSAGPAGWDWHEYQVGDGFQVLVNPTQVAQIREFAFQRGYSQVVNSALCTPLLVAAGAAWRPPTTIELAGQLVEDAGSGSSQDLYGIRSWSAQSLLTGHGIATGNNALQETKAFAQYYVDNYKTPRNRISQLGFRSMQPGQPGAGYLWLFITKVDIADQIDVTISSPGGGGFSGGGPDGKFFVEGVHEISNPAAGAYDDVTLTLDVSPASYYATMP